MSKQPNLTLRKLQQEQKEWSDRNFPNREGYYQLLGLVEEVGELAHAHLKQLEGIRRNEDHRLNIIDAIGDIVVFLAGYCNDHNFDLQDCVDETWKHVKKRDWAKNPVDGVSPTKADDTHDG